MQVRNPYRYYPKFVSRLIYADGRVEVYRGMAEAATLYFPGEEEDILAIAMVVLDAGNKAVAETMWVDGRWQDYNEERLNQIEQDAQKEEELEEELDPDPDPEREEDYWPVEDEVDEDE